MFVPVEGELEEGAEGEVEEVEVGLGGSHGVTGRVRTEAEREREALALARVRRQNPLVPVGARIKYKGNRHKPRERERETSPGRRGRPAESPTRPSTSGTDALLPRPAAP